MRKNLNVPRIEFSTLFDKHLRNASDEIKIALQDALDLFKEDSNHPALRNHPLKEKFAGFRSIDVADDWRAIFKETISGDRKVIIFHMIGTHEDLYES